jgi:hypothetical protein
MNATTSSESDSFNPYHAEPGETPNPDSNPENEFVFKEMSWISILSLGLGVCAFLTLGFLYFFIAFPVLFAVTPGLAIILGIRGISMVRKYPNELTGGGFAKSGITLSLITLITGFSWITYDYFTEVPEGFERISYGQLHSADPMYPIPKSAIDLHGKKVFIKGFMFPPDYKTGIKKFILCRDNGDCCFGGQPKLTDMIYINIKGEDSSTDYHPYIHKVAGTFRVEQKEALHDLGQVVYHLDAEIVK